MRFYRVLNRFTSKLTNVYKPRHHVRFYSGADNLKNYIQKVSTPFSVTGSSKDLYDLDELQLVESEVLVDSDAARFLLSENSKDFIIQQLTKSASIEEVFNVFNENQSQFNSEHLTQSILVLYDLQKIYFQVNSLNGRTVQTGEFIRTLLDNGEFRKILNFIKVSLDDFSSLNLGYILLYLNRMGLKLDFHLLQDIDNCLRYRLEKDFNLSAAAIYFRGIFNIDHIKPLYQTRNIIPKVFEEIEKCNNIKDLSDLTMCLNKINLIIGDDIIKKYKKKIVELLKNGVLTADHATEVLKVILFLNYPNWRLENSELISECMLSIQDKVPQFNVDELILFYGVFFKNQEPGEILNIMQRSASKFIRQIDEYSPHLVEKKLKLFSSLIYFSSPLHKTEYRKVIEQYVKICSTVSELFFLRKLLCYVKVSDESICNMFWDKLYKLLNKDTANVFFLSQTYLNFNTDIEDYRHFTIEKFIKKRISQELLDGNVTLFPSNLIDVISFYMVYGHDRSILKFLIHALEQTYRQLSDIECLKLSQHVHFANKIHEDLVTDIRTILNKSTRHILTYSSNYSPQLLLKGCIARNDLDFELRDDLLISLKNLNTISSKLIETSVFCILSCDALIPELLNKFTYYIVNNRRNILAFNIEKVLYACYCLGYYPINGEEFFPIAADIILRDQERLSGLALLQSALSLCYFNNLPTSFIKQIFNVEFMDKLDIELANCYFKDKYPQRVRQNLMQLNRAVCLEYPENNIPWFHHKFVNEQRKDILPSQFSLSVKEHLVQIVGQNEYIQENITTPYGYFVDFVLNLNNKQEFIKSNSEDIATKVALLLVKNHVFTRFYITLKGKYQMKKRHLEMFGYKVALINYDDWMNLLYAGERLDFIREKIWCEKGT